MPLQPDELRQQMLYQLGALIAIARSEGTQVGHFSFHAAMGNMVNRDPALADLMMNAIATVDAKIVVFVTAGSEIEKAAKRAKLKTLALFWPTAPMMQAGARCPWFAGRAGQG